MTVPSGAVAVTFVLIVSESVADVLSSIVSGNATFALVDLIKSTDVSFVSE